MIKPIMVGAPGQEDKLSEIEKHWDNIASSETMDQFNPYDLYNDFKAVCLRLRKEVKRHKKTKKKLAELQAERTNIDANFKLMADSYVELVRENKRLKKENHELIEQLNEEEHRRAQIRVEWRNRRLDG